MQTHMTAGLAGSPAVAAGLHETASCCPAARHRALPLLWSSGCQLLLALLLCLSQLQHASAQTVSENDWMDSSYTTEYRAASVVTNLWIAAFAVTSALFGLLGESGFRVFGACRNSEISSSSSKISACLLHRSSLASQPQQWQRSADLCYSWQLDRLQDRL